MPSEAEVERMVVRLIGDGSSYNTMLKTAEKNTKSSMSGLSKDLDKAEKATKRLTDEQRTAQRVIKQTDTNVEAYDREIAELTKALKAGELSQERFNRAVDQARTKLKAAERETARANSSMLKFSKGARTAGRQMASAGRALSLGLTLPIVGIGAVATREFAQFDQAMTKSTSIMEVTEAQIEALRKKALDVSTGGKAIQTPKEIADSYFFLASAGKSAEQSMALIAPVTRFATAGAFDMARATDLLTDAQSALGLTSKDVAKDMENIQRVSDVLVRANTLANASVEQFSTALTTKAGAALKAYNIELEDGAALLAAYADQGVKAELAGNAVDRVVRLLTKASKDNAEAFKTLGVEVFNAEGEFRSFENIIGDIERATRGMSTEQRAAALEMLGFEARVQQVILPLLGTSEAIGRYAEELRNAGGSTEEVANKQMKSFSNRMKVVKNQLSAIAIEIGEQLVPHIETMVNLLRTGIDAWNGLDKSTKNTIIVVAGIVAGLGPLLVILGSVTSAVGSLISVIGVASGALAGLSAGAVAGLAGGFVILGVAVASVIALITDMIGSVIDLNNNLAEANKLQDQLFEIRDKQTQKIISQASKLQGLEKQSFFDAEIARAEKSMQGLASQIISIKKQLESGELKGKSEIETKLELKEAKQNLKNFQQRVETIKAHIEANPIEQAIAINVEEAEGEISNKLNGAELEESIKQALEAELAPEVDTDGVDKLISKYRLLANTVGMTSREIEIATSGATGAQLKALKALDKSIAAQEKEAKVVKSVKSFTEQLRKEVEDFGKTSTEKKIAELKRMGATEEDLREATQLAAALEEKEALAELEEATSKDFVANVRVEGFDAVEIQSAEALRRFEQFRDTIQAQLQSPEASAAQAKNFGKGKGINQALNMTVAQAQSGILETKQQEQNKVLLRIADAAEGLLENEENKPDLTDVFTAANL